MNVHISICIPVYNTEPYLVHCLESIVTQNFTGAIEVLVLSDASPGRDEKGWTAEKIVNAFKHTLNIRYMENSQNLALVESRRRLVNESHGDYIFMLDSDDFLPHGALSALYEAAIKNDADVVQGDIVTYDLQGKKSYRINK